MIRKFFALLLVFVLVLSLAACNKEVSPGASDVPNNSNQSSDNAAQTASNAPVEITISFKWMPNGLDPISEDSPTNMSVCYNHIFDRLVNFDLDNNWLPGVAKSWKQIDGVTWEFEINLDYVFHNGDPLTMDDIVFSILRIKDIPKSADTGNLIDDVTYVGNTLTLKVFEENNTVLPRILTAPVIVSKSYIEANGDDGIYLYPVGTGPYKVTEFIPGTTVVLETWDGYPFEKPQIDKISIIVIAEDAARYVTVETGQSQFACDISAFEMDLADKNDKLDTFYGEGRRTGFICFNCQKPPFDNVNVRRALAYALDRDGFCALAGGSRPPITSPLFGGYSMYIESSNTPEFDLAKAKEMLAAEGFSDSNPLRFEVITNLTEPGIELYQSALKSIGVELELTIIELSAFLLRDAAGDFDAIWTVQANRGNHPLTDLDRFDSNLFGSRDTARYHNDRVQEIIERLRITNDTQETNNLVVEINDILGEEMPVITVVLAPNFAIMDKRLTDVIINGDKIISFVNAKYIA